MLNTKKIFGQWCAVNEMGLIWLRASKKTCLEFCAANQTPITEQLNAEINLKVWKKHNAN